MELIFIKNINVVKTCDNNVYIRLTKPFESYNNGHTIIKGGVILMLKVPKKDNVGIESYYYVGNTVINSFFNVLLAGVTEPDSNYFIYHPACKLWVFEYVISGKGYIVTKDKTYTVTEGDFYAVSEGTECYYYSDKKNPFKKIWINLTGNLVRHLMGDYGLNDGITIRKCDVQNLFEEMLINFKDDKNDFIGVQLKFHEIIANISPVRAEVDNVGLVESIHNYIIENVRSELEVDDLCKKFFISRVHLSQLFKKKYGISPYKFFIKAKMELAADMLVNSDMSIKAIAMTLSYADPHHFSNVFNKHFNLSPRAYRSKHKIVLDEDNL